MTELTPSLALDTRTCWPADLRLLADRYPREVWEGHANLGSMAQFWLQRHDMFREIAGALTDATAAFRDGTATAEDFRAWFPPRLQFFLQQLNAHHQVEDLHYFPIFRVADDRLTRGFDVLEGDHHQIHADMARTAETANALLRALQEGGDPMRRCGDNYADASGTLLKGLVRHLDDEEDLIVPLILDRSEEKLGVAHHG